MKSESVSCRQSWKGAVENEELNCFEGEGNPISFSLFWFSNVTL